MGNSSFKMDLIQMSAVHEMSNIGLGHAMTSLATMTGHTFNMAIPSVDSVPVTTITELVGGSEELTVGVLMPFDGETEGQTAFLFPWVSAQGIWRMLVGDAPESIEDINELHASVMLEIGNILNSSFLNAISDMTQLTMHATPPVVSIDMAVSVVSSIVCTAEERESVALAIETSIYDEDSEIKGFFLCIPTVETLKKLFVRLGIAEAA